MRGRMRWLVALVGALALLGSACNAKGEVNVDNPTTSAPDESPDVSVGVGLDLGDEGLVAKDNEFDPASFSVASGDSFTFSNEGGNEHNFSLTDADISEDVEPGESTDITIDLDPGTYDFFCEYHESEGMTGTVTVE